jgi:AcrR family transcriptional regulator
MVSDAQKINRGPAAAPENRRRILEAARRVFSQHGYHAPLSAVAKEAGVGQGVLYRHFPSRLELANAVFDADWDEYEHIAADPAADSFQRLWSLAVRHTIEKIAFIEMVADARRNLPNSEGRDRIRRLVEQCLGNAQAAGAVDSDLTADDVMLALRMVYGIVVSAADSASSSTGLRSEVTRALAVAGRLPHLV